MTTKITLGFPSPRGILSGIPQMMGLASSGVCGLKVKESWRPRIGHHSGQNGPSPKGGAVAVDITIKRTQEVSVAPVGELGNHHVQPLKF
jgi:hypothetical protein